ncbi:MAG: LysR substrate-binding domain-containing protein [Pseudomonadota bacterium]
MRYRNLNSLVYFEAVARHTRITTAAQELYVSPSAVSQQIRSLESSLGLRLFRRIKRRLVLTEEGEKLYHSASKALDILNEGRNQLSRSRDQLIIRVSASFGVRWLAPRLADFITKNPRWDMHIDATPEITDFEKERVDFDLRYGQGHWDGLYMACILRDLVLPLCCPDYLRQQQPSQRWGDFLAQGRLIHTVKAHLTWDWWTKHFDCPNVDTAGGLRFDRSSMSLQAAKDGVGIALESAILAAEELRNGTLVPVFPTAGAIEFPAYWIICPARHLATRSVRVFQTWIEAQATHHTQQLTRLLKSLGCHQRYPLDRLSGSSR